MRAQGRYFLPGSAVCVETELVLAGNTLQVAGADGFVTAAPMDQVRASSRLGNVPRKLEFPGGGCFETADNDAIDAMLQPRDRFLHRLEKSWRAVLAAVLLAAAAAGLFAFYGVPVAAAWLARHTPDAAARFATSQTLDILEGRLLKPSRLSSAQREHTEALFREVARAAPRGEKGYRLLLRDAPLIGPNAFALPDGTVVTTDQIVIMARSGEELQGVFAHEASHVDHAHGLQRVYQASLVPAAVAFITGDISQAGHIANILPGVLLQSAYSREFESQADDDAKRLMAHMGKSTAGLADLLERIEARMCGKKGCLPSWLGSHPVTAARAARLRGH